MANPAMTTLTWVRGTTKPFVFRVIRNGAPLPFDDIRLTFYNKKGKNLAFRATISNDGGIIVLDPATGLCKFTPTSAQTRALTESKDLVTPMNKYELEFRNGLDEEVYLMGDCIGLGGINDDETDEEIS